MLCKYNNVNNMSHHFFFKEWNWVICKDVDGPRDCHTEWSLEEKSKYHILMHICEIWKISIDDLIYRIRKQK